MTEIKTITTVTDLTRDSVSILKQNFIELNGEQTQVGENFRTSYVNSIRGRQSLVNEQSAQDVAAVLAKWGDTPTIKETEVTNNEE